VAKKLDERMVLDLLRCVRISLPTAKVHGNTGSHCLSSSSGWRGRASEGVRSNSTHSLGDSSLTRSVVRLDAGDKLRILQTGGSLRQLSLLPRLSQPCNESSDRLPARGALPTPSKNRDAQQQSRPTSTHEYDQKK